MPVLYRGECRRSLTSIKSEQGTMVITEKALFWWKSHRTKTVWSGKKEEDPPPDLTVSVDQIVSCRETSLHGERLLLLSLRDGTQPHFLSETFPQLMTALQMALEYDRRAKTAEEEKRRGPFVSVPGKGVQPGKNPVVTDELTGNSGENDSARSFRPHSTGCRCPKGNVPVLWTQSGSGRPVLPGLWGKTVDYLQKNGLLFGEEGENAGFCEF